MVSVPTPPGGEGNLVQVSCTSADACWAVGASATPGSAVARTLALRFDGTGWQAVPTPDGAAGPSNLLLGVACVTANDCWAAGQIQASAPPPSSFGISGLQALAHYDGHAWSLLPEAAFQGGPSPGELNSVACVSERECFAAGGAVVGPPPTPNPSRLGPRFRPVLLRWDGASWSPVPLPSAIGEDWGLESFGALSCFAPTDCWAFGFYLPPAGTTYRALALHFDGSTWTLVPTPDPGVQRAPAGAPPSYSPLALPANGLGGVACPSPADCWATGGYMDAAGFDRPMLLHFDGRAWSLVPVPSPGGPTDSVGLNGLACPASNDCWALGFWNSGTPPGPSYSRRVFALHYDGRGWALVDLPNPAVPTASHGVSLGPSQGVTGLACPSVGLCLAVGGYSPDPSGVAEPLVLEGVGG